MLNIDIMVTAFSDELEKIAYEKRAGFWQSVGGRISQIGGKGAKGAKAATQVAEHAAPAATQAVTHAAPAVAQTASHGGAQASQEVSKWRKAAPYAGAAIGGAIGFQQLRKAGKDWETGRAMRLQQEAYSPT